MITENPLHKAGFALHGPSDHLFLRTTPPKNGTVAGTSLQEKSGYCQMVIRPNKSDIYQCVCNLNRQIGKSLTLFLF